VKTPNIVLVYYLAFINYDLLLKLALAMEEVEILSPSVPCTPINAPETASNVAYSYTLSS
jgi:hypothetical protein